MMIKRPFFGFRRPRLPYRIFDGHGQAAVTDIALPQRAGLLVKAFDPEAEDTVIRKGARVRTGEKLPLGNAAKDYVISPVTGTIEALFPWSGYLAETYTAVAIKVDEREERDLRFKEVSAEPEAEGARRFLGVLPGAPDFAGLLAARASLEHIVVQGVDQDLLVATNQYVVKEKMDLLSEGIQHLKKLFPGGKIVLTVPEGYSFMAERTGVEVQAVRAPYPAAHPRLIAARLLRRATQPPGGRREQAVGFISAEGVMNLALAYGEGQVPVHKLLTVIDSKQGPQLVRARVGTALKEVLGALNLATAPGDTLVMGGPMKGRPVYSEDMPVLPDTDALLVQEEARIPDVSGTQCINCGECVRACPVRIPVNMLVRLLEHGSYEGAARQYDLFSCIECGLCSYVCVAHIPVFHYIMLGKHELALAEKRED